MIRECFGVRVDKQTNETEEIAINKPTYNMVTLDI